MEISIKVLFGIVLVVVTFLVILVLVGGLTSDTGNQLSRFFDFMGELEPPSIGG